MDARARLTIVEVISYAVAVFVFGLLIPPIYSLLNQNVAMLGTGDLYLFRTVIPAAILTVLVVIIATAVGGGAR